MKKENKKEKKEYLIIEEEKINIDNIIGNTLISFTITPIFLILRAIIIFITEIAISIIPYVNLARMNTISMSKDYLPLDSKGLFTSMETKKYEIKKHTKITKELYMANKLIKKEDKIGKIHIIEEKIKEEKQE